MMSLRTVAALVPLGLGAFLPFALPQDIPPRLSPAKAKKTFQIAKGLQIEVLAHGPTVQQPVCNNLDHPGRLWVLQYLQKPNPRGAKAVDLGQDPRTRVDPGPQPPPKGPRGADKI